MGVIVSKNRWVFKRNETKEREKSPLAESSAINSGTPDSRLIFSHLLPTVMIPSLSAQTFLHFQQASSRAASPSGKAGVCKTLIPSSNLGAASRLLLYEMRILVSNKADLLIEYIAWVDKFLQSHETKLVEFQAHALEQAKTNLNLKLEDIDIEKYCLLTFELKYVSILSSIKVIVQEHVRLLQTYQAGLRDFYPLNILQRTAYEILLKQCYIEVLYKNLRSTEVSQESKLSLKKILGLYLSNGALLSFLEALDSLDLLLKKIEFASSPQNLEVFGQEIDWLKECYAGQYIYDYLNEFHLNINLESTQEFHPILINVNFDMQEFFLKTYTTLLFHLDAVKNNPENTKSLKCAKKLISYINRKSSKNFYTHIQLDLENDIHNIKFNEKKTTNGDIFPSIDKLNKIFKLFWNQLYLSSEDEIIKWLPDEYYHLHYLRNCKYTHASIASSDELLELSKVDYQDFCYLFSFICNYHMLSSIFWGVSHSNKKDIKEVNDFIKKFHAVCVLSENCD
jgi:hypothetical protein